MLEILQEKVYKAHITDLDELKERLRTEWAKLDHVVIAAAIRQWRRRLSACVKAGGRHGGVPSLTFVTVSLVILVADVDDMNSYALFVGLLLQIVRSGVVM